mmetsp:Transcript_20608/g.52977  ORF Transcript_20608/g.52977 Transcript_20608/m.52977 type:complete len:107 (-) Transcript_20608:97-417(-)
MSEKLLLLPNMQLSCALVLPPKSSVVERMGLTRAVLADHLVLSSMLTTPSTGARMSDTSACIAAYPLIFLFFFLSYENRQETGDTFASLDIFGRINNMADGDEVTL